MHKYERNPYYKVIANQLYFVCRGGKLIFCRDLTLADYEKSNQRLPK